MWRVGVGGPCAPHIILGGFVLITNILSLGNVFMGVDRSSRLLRSALCLLLILVLLFSLVTRSYAVVVSSVVVSAVLAAMGAFGIGTLVHGMSTSEVSSWISSELNSWATSLSDTVSNLLPISSIAVNPLGALTLMPTTAARIVTFVRFLLNKYSVSAGGQPVTVVSSSSFTNQPVPVVSTLNVTNVKSSGVVLFHYSTWPVYLASNVSNTFSFTYGSGPYYLVAVSPTSGGRSVTASDAYSTVIGSNLSTTYTYNSHTYYYGRLDTIDARYLKQSSLPNFTTLNAGLDAACSLISAGPSSLSLVPDGSIDYPDYVGDDEEEMPYVVDWGGSPGISVEDAADAILDRVVSNDLTTDGSVSLDPDNVTWPDVVSAPLVSGLDEIFPFCIPFDIYHFFQALSATPTAPHFEIPFYVPNLINYTLVIDLSSFDSVAQIFRTMELLAFCVGLAFVTRKLIRG